MPIRTTNLVGRMPPLSASALSGLMALLGWLVTPIGAAEVDFNRDIRPLLAKNCYACHGPDEEAREAELRLDTAEGAAADLGGYSAIRAGDPAASRLIERIESKDQDEVMPPIDSGLSLSAEEKQQLKAWIAAGADYDIHWSFAVPQKAKLPAVKHEQWPQGPIDYFVLRAMEARGLSPASEADRYRLIRRLSLDLTGLPPDLKTVDKFASDESEQAYESLVDALLESDAYGEHWARMWLDLARYADTKGYEKDRHREIWRYRDWVIQALNRDMPYDQFTLEQLAGDLLPNASTEQILATAFHRNTMTNDEGGTDNEEFRVAAVKDRVDTTIQVWMGLTMGCAKCHSHKYDPLSQHDYYAFYAFFNQTQDADRGDDFPTLPAPTKEQAQLIAKQEALLAELQDKLKAESKNLDAQFASWRKSLGDSAKWRRPKLLEFKSNEGVNLTQGDNGDLVASGERPLKDDWTLTFEIPSKQTITALRLDVLRKDSDEQWPNDNMVLSELSLELLNSEGAATPLKLKNARADFSQSKWPVANAIDGKLDTGWALAPQINKPHVAIFDLQKALEAPAGSKLRVTMKQRYGQKLVLARFRVSVNELPPKLLVAEVDEQKGLRAGFERTEHKPTIALRKRIGDIGKRLNSLRAGVPKIPVMKELAAGKRRQTHIQIRGNFLSPGEVVEARVPGIFGEFDKSLPKNRLGVAKWITQADNPLTARVMVNRVWARLFGLGIVETEEDFGAQGSAPSHPELLDWLAVDFRENGWSLKQLIKTIVLSATYRQSARVSRKKLTLDPPNRWLSRGARFRLSAETVRDQALASSGLLTRKVGGPSVMPPQPSGVWKSTYNTLKWKNATGADRYRRGLYTYWKRTSPYPAMTTFDAGSGEVCLIRRVRTNTPLQALVTLNDPAFIEAAGALSGRMQEGGGTAMEKLTRGFRLVLVRPPTEAEAERLLELYESISKDHLRSPKSASQLLEAAGRKNGDAALLVVANVLLNLDETLMKP